MSAAGAGTAAAAAAAVAAVAYLPAFKRTREGIAEGLGAELELGGEVAESWILKSAGGAMGGLSGWVVSSTMMERAAARGNSLAAYARVPGAAMGALFSASLAAELAQPAVLAGKRLGSAAVLGAEGLSADLSGGGGTRASSAAAGLAERPRPLLEETKRRLEALGGGVSEQPRTAEGDGDDGGEAGSEALLLAEAAARVVEEDAAKLALVAELRGLRAREEALRAELLHAPASASGGGSAGRRADLREQIARVVEMKAAAKRRCLAEHGQRLTRLMAAEVRSKAAALEGLRARQLSLRMSAAASEAAGDRAAARRLRSEAKALDTEKKALKREAAEALGVRLSRHARPVPKQKYCNPRTPEAA